MTKVWNLKVYDAKTIHRVISKAGELLMNNYSIFKKIAKKVEEQIEIERILKRKLK